MTKQEFLKLIEKLQENITTIKLCCKFFKQYNTKEFTNPYLCDHIKEFSSIETFEDFQDLFSFGHKGDNFSFLTNDSKQSITEKIVGLELFKLVTLENGRYKDF